MEWLRADNFYLSKEELLHSTPSRREGVDAATEKQLRVRCSCGKRFATCHKALLAVQYASGQCRGLLHQDFASFLLRRCLAVSECSWGCCT